MRAHADLESRANVLRLAGNRAGCCRAIRRFQSFELAVDKRSFITHTFGADVDARAIGFPSFEAAIDMSAVRPGVNTLAVDDTLGEVAHIACRTFRLAPAVRELAA